jgi:hypothetical protein
VTFFHRLNSTAAIAPIVFHLPNLLASEVVRLPEVFDTPSILQNGEFIEEEGDIFDD